MAQTKITRARFTLSPFTSEQMRELGVAVLVSVKKRIHSGLTVDEQPAKPLKVVTAQNRNGAIGNYLPYTVQKERMGKQPIRDLFKTGGLMNSVQVLSASEDRAILGSNNPVKDKLLHKNNRISPQFGMSPSDKLVMQKKVGELVREAIKVVRTTS